MTARQEKVREALVVGRMLAASNPRSGYRADYFAAALAEVKEWEALRGRIRFCPFCAHGYEWQDSDPVEGPCAGCARAEAAEAETAELHQRWQDDVARMGEEINARQLATEAAEAVIRELLPWAGKQTFKNDEVWVKARALVGED